MFDYQKEEVEILIPSMTSMKLSQLDPNPQNKKKITKIDVVTTALEDQLVDPLSLKLENGIV